MTQVKVGMDVPPQDITHDISLAGEGEKWGLQLDGKARGIQEVSQTASTILQRGSAGKFGGYGPTFGDIKQDTWHGGRGLEEFPDDPTRYFDSENMFTLVPGRLFPTLQWQFADCDNRDYNQIAFADVEWHALRGTERYISSKFTAAAQSGGTYDAAKVYVWLRRVGTPGTLTGEIWSDTDGKPNAKQGSFTDTVTTSNVADTVSVWEPFEAAAAEALADGPFHVVLYGASTDNATNHWEVGVNNAGSASHYSTAGSTWTAASYTMYYRVVDADVAVKWHYFMLASNETYQVSEPASGTSKLEVWDETNDEWDAVAMKAGDATLSNIVKSVAVGNGLAHMARGTTEVIGVFYHDGSDYRFDDDAAAKADHLYVFYDPVDGAQLWRAENDSVDISRSDVKAFATNLAFGTEITVGDTTHNILSLSDYNDQLWVRKADSVWSVKNDRASKLAAGLGAVFETNAYVPMLAKDLYLFIAWSHSVERLYGGTLDDIGPWKGSGLPHGRQGVISAMCSGVGMTFWAMDAGTSGTSSVLAFDGIGLHEIFRAPEAGQRIRNVFWQPVSGAGGRLWISCGGDSIYMTFPEHTLNPLHDTGMSYHHEGVLTTATYTMGAERLPKLFKELDFITEGLGSSADIVVDYKVDEDIGDSTSKWTEVTRIHHSPDDSVPLNLGNKRRIRFRIRARTSDSDKPPKIIATVLDCFARTPVKRQWNLRIKISDKQVTKDGAPDHGAAELYKWLLDASGNAEDIFMRANDELMDELWVIVEPPNFFRSFINRVLKQLGGSVTLTLRES